MNGEEYSYGCQRDWDEKNRILMTPTHYGPLSFNMLKLSLVSKGFQINEATFESDFNLRCRDGNYNLMAELLSDNNMVSFIFAKFKGNTKAVIIQRNDYGNHSLLQSYQRMKDRLIAENIVKADSRECLYDMDSVNEVLINALFHNDWSITEPLVSFFDDRLEIISHGGLPKGMTKEDFFKGRHYPRNEALRSIFLKLGIVERTGSGVKQVIEKYGKEVFDIRDSYVNVIIPFNRKVID